MESLTHYTTELIAAAIGGVMVGALLYGIVEQLIDNWRQQDNNESWYDL